MAAPGNPHTLAFAAPASATELPRDLSGDLEDELRSAAEDFERGDYIELTDE